MNSPTKTTQPAPDRPTHIRFLDPFRANLIKQRAHEYGMDTKGKPADLTDYVMEASNFFEANRPRPEKDR